jgi:phytoene desaturase (3,4-didehydrolycopene-forming)
MSGTGVPICLAGARITAEQILAKEGRPVPWPEYNSDTRKPFKSSLDKMQWSYSYGGVFFALLAFIFAMLVAIVF